MNQLLCFADFFHSLWGVDPFPWQRSLTKRLGEGEWPKVLDLPTAAGKTACIDVAIYALAAQANRLLAERTAPRRIWFVVDRRIVVGEAFARAERIAEKLRDDGWGTPAVPTRRGHLDCGPARLAALIGSRRMAAEGAGNAVPVLAN